MLARAAAASLSTPTTGTGLTPLARHEHPARGCALFLREEHAQNTSARRTVPVAGGTGSRRTPALPNKLPGSDLATARKNAPLEIRSFGGKPRARARADLFPQGPARPPAAR